MFNFKLFSLLSRFRQRLGCWVDCRVVNENRKSFHNIRKRPLLGPIPFLKVSIVVFSLQKYYEFCKILLTALVHLTWKIESNQLRAMYFKLFLILILSWYIYFERSWPNRVSPSPSHFHIYCISVVMRDLQFSHGYCDAKNTIFVH